MAAHNQQFCLVDCLVVSGVVLVSAPFQLQQRMKKLQDR